MRITMVILVVAVFLTGFNYVSVAQTHGHSEDEKAAVKVGNEICPVSGENVEATGGGIEHIYDGKIYNLCCAGCVDIFKKDPEKYSAIAEKNAAEQGIEEEYKESHHDH